MKKIVFIIMLLLLCIGIGSCSKPQSRQEPVTWDGTLLDFIIRGNKMYMGKVSIPCDRQNLIDAGIFPEGTEFPDDSRTAEASPFMVAPEKAYFTDVEEEAWIVYYSSDECVFVCSVVFAKSDQDSRDQLYYKVYETLHTGLGESGAVGTLEIQFSESRIPKVNPETLDTYGWEIEDDQYPVYGYSIGELEHYGDSGWRGKIQDTANQYGFRFVIEYFGEEKRTGVKK